MNLRTKQLNKLSGKNKAPVIDLVKELDVKIEEIKKKVKKIRK